MDSYSVQAVLSVKDKNFTSGMTNASNVMAGIDSSAQKSSKSAGALGTAFAVANKVISGACSVIKSSVTDAVNRVDTLNNYPKIMEQMGFSSESAEKSIDKLSDGIQGLPTSLDSIVSSAQNIALITGNLDEATDVALALNDAMLASGASTDGAERATEAYDKMLSTGKVNSQNWMTLQQNMGYALKEVAKQLGITSGSTQELYDKMQAGEITFDEFNQALIECDTCTGGFAETASIACDGIATSWENVKTAVVRGVANMIQAWNDAANDNGIPTIQSSLHTLQNVVDTCFTAASKVITVFVKNLDTIVSACVPVVAGIASLKVIQTVSKQFGDFKNKLQDSAKVLQDYTPKAEKVSKASENLGNAKKAAEKAIKAEKEAFTKVATAAGKAADADDKVQAATKKYEAAQEKANAATEKGGKASEELEQAERELEAAKQELKQANKEAESAEEEYSQKKEQAAAASSLYTDAENEQAAAIEGVTIKEIAQSAMANVMTGAMKPAKAAMEAFNAACDANPLMLIITAVTTVISVMKGLESALKKAGIMAEDASDRWKDLKENIDDLYDSLEASDKEMQKNIDNLNADRTNVERLWSQVRTLASYQNLSADMSERMNDYIWQLNESVPGLGLAIDDVTGSLNQSMGAVDAYIQAWEQLDKLSVLTEEYNQALENQAATHLELKEAQEEYNNTLADMQDSSKILTNCSANNIIAYFKEKNAVEDLEEEEEIRTQMVEQLASQREATTVKASEALAEAYNNEVQKLKDAVAEDTISYEDLSEANQETVDSMKSNINDLADTISDGTQSINTDLGVTRDEYLKTQEDNQKAVEDWGNNMESLRNRMEALGLDTAVLDQWAEVPEDGIPLAAEFVNASDDELIKLAGLAESDVETAATSSLQAWGAATDDIPDSIKEYITDPTEETIGEQLRGIDWSEPTTDLMDQLWESMAGDFDNLDIDSLGISIDDGVAHGIDHNIEAPKGSINDMFTNTWKAGKSAIGMGSPAAEYVPMGESIDEGIAKGIRESESVVENAAKRILRNIEQTFNSLGSTTSSGLDKMLSAFKSGMASMQSTVSSGMTSIKSAMTSGMSSIASSVTSGMSTVKSAMTSGFSSMSSTVISQMSKIKSSFSSGMSSIKSVVTSGMSNVKSVVTSAMNSMVTSISSSMNSMNSAMRSGMTSVQNTARSVANSITTQFSGLYNDLYNSGAHAMNGLINGMISRESGVIKTAQSIANNVTNTINSALQIGSPSKVLKKSGINAGEGFVLGLKDMLSDIKSMAGEMADAVNTMVFGSFDSPKLAFAGGMDMNVNYAYTNEDMLNALGDIRDALGEDTEYEFTIPLEVDGRQIAKATATFTQDELNKMEARNSRKQQFSIGG